MSAMKSYEQQHMMMLGRGMSLQSIVEREQNMLDLKLKEFESLLQNPYVAATPSTAWQSGPFGAVTRDMSSVGQTPNITYPSRFVQLPVPSNMGFASSPFTALFPSSGNSNFFSNFGQTVQDPDRNISVSASTALRQAADISTSLFALNLAASTGDTQQKPQEAISIDRSVWLMEKWMPGKIPEIAPPDELIF